jgi:hypothetical protein
MDRMINDYGLLKFAHVSYLSVDNILMVKSNIYSILECFYTSLVKIMS